jgi:predicted ATPase
MTRFGAFTFSGKISLAEGRLHWRIWQQQAAPAPDQHAAGEFFGPALEVAMQIDAFAAPGEIVLTTALQTQLAPAGATVSLVATDVFRLDAWPVTPPPAADLASDDENAPELAALATAFFPDLLLTLPAAGEFRRVTSIFVNCAPAADPTQSAVLFDHLFTLLARYGGYLCRVGRIGGKDAGTTLLIFFGAPISTEHDAARALAFLLELQAVAPAPIRAGVTTARAYAGFVGGVACAEYTCHSIHVNQAARQMIAAAWGEIWLDAATMERTRDGFQVEPLGMKPFKGFAAPRPVYRLLGRRQVEAIPLYEGTLVGRTSELAQLERSLHPIRRGRFGGAVYIVGEAGIGKSRLVNAFRRTATEANPQAGDAAPVTWLFGQTDAILRRSLQPFRDMLRTYFAQSAVVDVAANQTNFARTLDALLAATTDPVLAAELDRARSFLGALVDLSWEGSLYEQLDAALRFANLLDALKALFKAESLRRPLVLQIEDAHDLDAESYAFLQLLTRNVEGFPLLLVLTARPEGEFAAESASLLDAGLPQTTIRLEGLDREGLGALGSARLAGVLAAPLLDLLVERTEGNPFFAEQVLLYLRERGNLVADQGVWDLDPALKQALTVRDLPAVEAALPIGVGALLTARLDQLPPPVRHVVQTAAVLGREFDARILAHMLAPRPALSHELAVAAQAAFWAPVDAARYRFRHALLCDAAYEMQLRGRLRQLHHAAAAAIGAVHAAELAPHYAELVHHYRQSEDASNEQRFAGLAGAHAAAQYANQDAVHFYSRALALTPATAHADRLQLILGRERVFETIGDHAQQRADLDALEALAQTTDDVHALATLYLRRAGLARLNGDYAAALHTVAQAQRLAHDSGAAALETASLLLAGRVRYQQGDYTGARTQLEAALTLASAANLRVEQAQILNNLGGALIYTGNFAAARQRLLDAQRISQAVQDRRTEASCLINLGTLAYRIGDYAAAHQHLEEALAASRAIGWRQGEAILLANLGNNAFDLGDFATAHRHHQDALAVCRELLDREGEAVSLDTLGLLAAIRGELPLAQSHFRAALAIQRAIGDQRSIAYTLTHWGVLLAESGTGDATPLLEEALHLRIRLEEHQAAIDTRAALAWAAFAHGDASAQAGAAAIVAWLAEHGMEGVEFPAKVCVLCHHILAARGSNASHAQPAQRALALGHDMLMARAAHIQDASLRRHFLRHGYANAELLACCEAAGIVSA